MEIPDNYLWCRLRQLSFGGTLRRVVRSARPLVQIISIFAAVAFLRPTAGSCYGKRADVDAVDKEGQTALMRAAAAGDAEAVKSLIAKGADVNSTVLEQRGQRAITILAHRGYTGPVPAPGTIGETPLTMAAAAAHADVVKLLMDAGAKEQERKDGKALLVAASHGYSDLVKLLLDAGANKEGHVVRVTTFTTPWLGNEDTGSTITGSSRRNYPISGAISSSAAGGRQVTWFGGISQTPLTEAVRNGHIDVVKLLLDAGANKDGHAENYSCRVTLSGTGRQHYAFFRVGETALEAARESGNQDIVDLLISAGAQK
jgi:hypothetical protein